MEVLFINKKGVPVHERHTSMYCVNQKIVYWARVAISQFVFTCFQRRCWRTIHMYVFFCKIKHLLVALCPVHSLVVCIFGALKKHLSVQPAIISWRTLKKKPRKAKRGDAGASATKNLKKNIVARMHVFLTVSRMTTPSTETICIQLWGDYCPRGITYNRQVSKRTNICRRDGIIVASCHNDVLWL